MAEDTNVFKSVDAGRAAILKGKCGGPDDNITLSRNVDPANFHLARKHCINISDVPTNRLVTGKIKIYLNQEYYRQLVDMDGQLLMANPNPCGCRGH